MVLGVCRRVLQNVHDAEDAFQATFLVLARKAATIVPRDAVGAWLYGVAYRTAKKAKTMTARRRLKEHQFQEKCRAATPPEEAEQWQPVLDEELSRLPQKYQSAIVLCDLEGKTKKEAAGQLGCPEGTLSSWLVRGRRLLARRLTSRGVALSAGSLAAVLSASSASACVPPSLVVSTGKAAALFAAGQAAAGVISAKVAALTEGVLKAMLLSKLKTALVVLLVVVALAAGAAFQGYPSQAAGPIADATAAAPEPPATTVESQIAKVLKAHGGEKRLEKLKTFTLRINETSFVGGRRDYRFFVQLPDQLRTEYRFDDSATEKGSLIMVKNGDKKWRKLNDGETTAERGVADERAKFFGPRALLRLKDPAMKVSLLGERMAGDTAALLGDHATICVKLSRKDGKPVLPLHAISGMAGINEVLLYFDKEKGLLLKEEWDYRDLHCEIFYSDYKLINGIAVAQKVAQRTNGEVNYRSEVEFKIMDRLDAKLFQKP
jgi:RNA polymerase sigma factor (sigma-70 family)